jgi:hypothetical protein
MANDAKSVRLALANALADFKVDDSVIESAAKQLAQLPVPIRKIDICQFGICLDFFLEGEEWQQSLQSLLQINGGGLQKIEIFPYGILNPEMVHVQLGQSVAGIPRQRLRG